MEKFENNELAVEIATVKNEIKWIIIVGGSVITAVLAGFAYLISSEIPKQVTAASNAISGKLPDNFSERFSKLEQKVDDLQSRYGGITPSSLLTLVPMPGESLTPLALQARLQKADHLIESSYDLDLPGNPAQLNRVSARLSYVKDVFGSYSNVAPALMSAEAHLASYRLFSRGAYGTDLSLHAPARTHLNGMDIPLPADRTRINNVSVIANFTLDCNYTTGGAFDGDPQVISNVFIFQVRIRACQQKQLAYFTWVRTEFDHVTVMYNGGPLTLVQSTFKYCTFQFGSDPKSKEALAIIAAAAGKPVSIYLP